MKVLDLFSGAGGAGMGYHLAGFEVVGVDLSPQPRYPFPFIQADVLKQDPRFLRTFDLVHASPPCQFGTALRHAPGTRKDHLNLIPATRRLLQAAGVPYVIENVEAVCEHLVRPIRLCGTSFGLGAQGCELHRHRLFEASFPIAAPPCRHSGGPVVGVYGGHARKRSAKHGGRGTRDVWEGGHVAACSEAMGIDWMTLTEISEAIPPAFTKHIGVAFKAWLRLQQVAA